MLPKELEPISNNDDLDKKVKVWVCFVCQDLSIQKLRIIAVCKIHPLWPIMLAGFYGYIVVFYPFLCYITYLIVIWTCFSCKSLGDFQFSVIFGGVVAQWLDCWTPQQEVGEYDPHSGRLFVFLSKTLHPNRLVLAFPKKSKKKINNFCLIFLHTRYRNLIFTLFAKLLFHPCYLRQGPIPSSCYLTFVIYRTACDSVIKQLCNNVKVASDFFKIVGINCEYFR